MIKKIYHKFEYLNDHFISLTSLLLVLCYSIWLKTTYISNRFFVIFFPNAEETLISKAQNSQGCSTLFTLGDN